MEKQTILNIGTLAHNGNTISEYNNCMRIREIPYAIFFGGPITNRLLVL
jgi:hypothetical protein